MIDSTLKNRLVGVAVLLVLAAVLLPVLFDGANEKALLADTRMPAPPEVPAAETLLAEPPSLVQQTEAEIAAEHALAEPEVQIPPVAVAPGAPPAVPAVTSAAPSTVTPAVPAPVPAAANKSAPVAAPVAVTPAPSAPAQVDPRLAKLADAWDVQLAAVSTPESAEQLRTKLVTAGYKARVIASGKLFRVVAGPELRREDALAMRDKLAGDARFSKLKAMLVRYVP